MSKAEPPIARPLAGHLDSHLKYLEHRSHDEHESREDRSIFSKEDDQVERRDAVNDVMEHTSTASVITKSSSLRATMNQCRTGASGRAR